MNIFNEIPLIEFFYYNNHFYFYYNNFRPMNIYLRNSDKDFQRCARDSNKGELCPNRTMRQDRKDSACTGPISARIP